MNLRMGWAASLAVIAAMIAASLLVLGQLPPGARIATHFGADGQPNGWSAAWLGVSIMPTAALLVSLVISALPYIDPRAESLRRSLGALVATWLALLALLATVHAAILLHALGQPVDVRRLVTGAVGLMFVVAGNFLGKIRWNYTFGIRTPWTLANERVWDKTHRFGGRVIVATGLAMLLAAAVPLENGVRIAAILLPLPAALVLVLKSYLLWRQEQRSQA